MLVREESLCHFLTIEITAWFGRLPFLCGSDTLSGQSYEHRRGWIEDKLLELAGIFAIDVAAYAIMSNHYHVVLHIDKPQAEAWNKKQVIEHWHQAFTGNTLSQRYLRGKLLCKAELKKLDEDVTTWRERLMDISWFMRVLNEGIAAFFKVVVAFFNHATSFRPSFSGFKVTSPTGHQFRVLPDHRAGFLDLAIS